MEIDQHLILKLEKLAKLHLNEDERKAVKNDLQKIIDMFGSLSELNTQGVEPFTHFPTGNDLGREDKVGEHQPLAVTLDNAPTNEGEFFIVPKMIQ